MNSQTRFRLRRGHLGVGLTLVGVGSVLALAQWLSLPSTGRVISTGAVAAVKPVAVTHAVTPDPTPQLTNQYMSLSLPAGFKIRPVQPSSTGILYVQTLTKPSAMGTTLITIGIKQLPEGGMQGDSGYALRVAKPEQYQLTATTAAGERVTVARDKTASSVVAFWPHGQYLATISLSTGLENPSVDDNQGLVETLQTMLSTWQWR